MSNQMPQGHPSYQQPAPKKKKKWLPWVLGGVGVLFLGNLVFGGDEKAPSTAPVPAAATTTTSAPPVTDAPAAAPVPEKTKAPAPVEPALEVTSKKLIGDLESNALKAKNTYKDKRVIVSGYVGNIDASGRYFAVDPEPDAFVITGVQASLRSDAHREQVAELSKNDKVTVTGTITDVGEILGYTIKVESIS